MKIILLLSLLYTFTIANQTQIVLGSFTSEKNAKRHIDSINNFINKDIEFKAFFKSNSLISSYKKDGKYFSVVIKPFNDLTTQKKVLDYLKPKFKDTYIILLPKVKEEIKKVVPIKRSIKKQPFVKATPIKKQIVSNELNLSKIETKIEVKEPKTNINKKSYTINKLYVLIIFIILLILYFLRKKLNKKEDPALKTIIIDTPPLAEDILNKSFNKPSSKENKAVDVSDIFLKPK